MQPTVDTRADQIAGLTPLADGGTFIKPLAVVVERRSTSGGRPCYVIGVTSGVRTVERFLHTHRPVWTVRTARKKAADLQHDLDRGYINPSKALSGPSSRRACAEDLTGFVALPKGGAA